MPSGAGPAVALQPQGRLKTGALRPTAYFTLYALRSPLPDLRAMLSALRLPATAG